MLMERATLRHTHVCRKRALSARSDWRRPLHPCTRRNATPCTNRRDGARRKGTAHAQIHRHILSSVIIVRLRPFTHSHMAEHMFGAAAEIVHGFDRRRRDAAAAADDALLFVRNARAAALRNSSVVNAHSSPPNRSTPSARDSLAHGVHMSCASV